jgi:PAS domain S-box
MLGTSGALRHLALLWAFVISFDAYMAVDLWSARVEAERQARQLAISYVRLVEENASGAFDRVSLILRQAVSLIEERDLHAGPDMDAGRRAVLQAALAELQDEGYGIVSMSVADADGRVVANSVGAPSGDDLGDREYFRALRESTWDRPVVSQAVRGRMSGKWGVQVARALRWPDGGFAGMVVANIGLEEYFLPFYQSLLLPPGAAIALRDLQHRTVARYPSRTVIDDKPVPAEPVEKAFAEGMREGSYHRPSPLDGVEREVAFRRLSRYPLYAVAALADSDTLANWGNSVARTALFVLLMTGGAGFATVMLLRKGRLEREVRSNADKLALALQAANAGTWYWEAASGRLQWSPELVALYGRPPPPHSPDKWLALVHPEDAGRAGAEIREVLERRNTAYRSEFRIVDRDGQQRWLAAIGTVSYDRDGRAKAAFGVSIDITAAKLVAAQLEAARDEALDAKAEAERSSLARSKFLAAASHDLRQPVQSLLLLIEVMKMRLAGTPLEPVTGQMELALDALRLLLNSLLDISKLDAGVVVPALQDVALGPLLGRLGAEYSVRAAETGISLRVVPASLVLTSDQALLERLLRNLIENAIRYTPSGKIVVGCRRTKGWLRIDVVDSGIGIAPENHEAVFEEFHQVANAARDRAQGLGLGLAIVRRLAGLLGGRVELRSSLGRGSRFSLVLPWR